MFLGDRKPKLGKNRVKRSFEEAYLEGGLSKGEAERRAWKAISALMMEGSSHR